jgi:hypothetical protein
VTQERDAMSTKARPSTKSFTTSHEHDHAWRLVRDPRHRLRHTRFHVYKCDLCPATWVT